MNSDKTINKVLADIQQKLNVPKAQRNTFGNYNYRSCEDIVEAVKKLLPEGVIITLEDEMVQIGDRYYIKATATITDTSKWVSATAYAREPLAQKGMNEAQITGSASSYARKYALNGLLLIDDTKDADTQDNTEKETVQKMEKHEEEIAKITDMDKLTTYYQKNKSDGKELIALCSARKKELQNETS